MKLKKLTAAALIVSMVMGGTIRSLPPLPVKAATTEVEEGLVLYANFDGDSVASGFVKDLTGRENNGSIVGNVSLVDGINGKAISIDNGDVAGNASKDAISYVNFGKVQDLQFGSGDFTISLWLKTENNGINNGTIISNKDYTSGSNRGVALGNFNNPSDVDVRLNFSATGNSRVELKKIAANDDAWHQLTATFDRDGQMIVYMDGEEYAKTSMTSHANKTVDTGLDFVLGAAGNHKYGMSNCKIDELRVYNKVISAERVKDLYRDVINQIDKESLKKEDLVLYSSFDEKSIEGQVVKDISGRGNNGAIFGNVEMVTGIRGNAVTFHNKDTAGKENTTAQAYINYGTPDDLQFGTDDFSISFWCKTTDNGANNGTILGNKDYKSGSNIGLAIGNYNNPSVKDIRMNFSAKQGSRIEVKNISANDNKWHHIVWTCDRDGVMTVYMDGKEYSKVDMSSQKGLSVNTGLDFILGADGKKNLSIDGYVVDELRIYNCVIKPDVVSLLYKDAGSTIEIEYMLDSLNGITPNRVFPKEEMDELKNKLKEGKDLIQSLDDAEADKLLNELTDAYNLFLEGADPIISFQVVSDVHISQNNFSHVNSDNFVKGLEDIKKMDPDSSGLISIGDNTSNGTEAQVEGFYNILASFNPVANDKTLIALGNHDVRGINSVDWNKDPNIESSYWKTAYSLYMKHNAPYMPETNGKVYYDRWVDGYHFIVLNTENGLKDSTSLSEEQLIWFEEKMSENANSEKPIFVFVHQALNDTHWRSNVLNGFGEEDEKVKEILAKYPQAILMSGHIHNGFGVAEVIDRSYGTVIDVPSYNESENGYKERGIGYHVMVYEDCVAFRARNFKTSTWLPEYDIIVNLPGLPTLYMDASSLDVKLYTIESYAPLKAVMEKAENTMNRIYDQSELAWNTTTPPPEAFYSKEQRSEINQIGEMMQTAMNGLIFNTSSYQIYSKADVYLQAGSDAEKVSATYENYDAGSLRVKKSDGDQAYTRKTLLTFDLSKDLKNVQQANITFELNDHPTPNPGPNFKVANIYKVDTNWSPKTVTWNTGPEHLQAKAVGKIMPSDIQTRENGTKIVSVDVTDTIVNAIKNGETSISFEISMPEEANNNMLDLYSSRAEGKQKPTLSLSTIEKVENPEFKALRDKWREYLLGGSLDMKNSAVFTYIKNTNENTNELWNSMIKSTVTNRKNLWDDLDMSYVSGTSALAKEHSGNIAVTFYRLRDLAITYSTEGCDLYLNQEVKNELISALDYMVENHYSDSDATTPFFGNWWHWEIGGPIAFLNTAIILYDDLSSDQIKTYTSAVNRFSPVCDKPSGYPGSPAMTGANLIDKGTAVILSAILSENEDKMEHIKGAFKTVFTYVTSGDGFYEDGSFIQHQALAYMGGYGAQLYEKLSIFFHVLNDTKWELTYDDHAEQLVFDMIFEGMEPFLYNGIFVDMVSGRDITRNASCDKERGTEVLDAIMLMSDAMPTNELKDRFDQMIKYYVGLDEEFFYNNCVHISSIMKANDIMNDDSIQPRSEYALHKLFASMDKVVHTLSDYSFNISMHSSRTYGHELINDEGKRTWNISDGMTYLYNGDRNQYGEGYWATVDPKRLAGTTTEYVERSKGAGDRMKNNYSWVGGSSLGLFGTAGMEYNTLGNSGKKDGTHAKKSWFMFDNEIVAIGSDINSSTGNAVETIIDNRKILLDASNKVSIDGKVVDITDNSIPGNKPIKGITFENPSYLHLQGNVEGSDIGYYFPSETSIRALKELRIGDWIDQGTTSGKEQNSFATFWFAHGTNPENESYEYVLLPNMNESQTAMYAKNPDINVIANTDAVHAVRENKLGITAANFWYDKETTAAGITSNRKASVTVQQTADCIEIGVADPTQLNKGTIELSFALPAGKALEKDDSITVVQTSPFIKIAVNTKGLVGKTSIVKFTKAENVDREIVSIKNQPESLKVSVGTSFNQLPLPKTIAVLVNDMSEEDIEVKWSKGAYNKESYGVYTLTGELILPEGLNNSENLMANIMVQVGEINTLAICDTYVQGGTDANKPNVDYALKGDLIVKSDLGDQSYTRKSLIKFSLDGIPDDYENVYLELQLKGTPGVDFSNANVYAVESNWDEKTVTFNTMPKRLLESPIAVITRDLINESLQLKLDIRSAVKYAKDNGLTELSFEISIPTQAKNNYMGIHSLETSTTDAIRPTISWEKPSVLPRVDKSNLTYIVKMIEDLDLTKFSNVDINQLQQQLNLAKEILADGNVEAEQVKEIELLLTKEIIKFRLTPVKKLQN